MAQQAPASQNGSSYGPESVDSVGETSEEKDPFTFLWVVNNFSRLRELPEVKSPVFHGGAKNNYGWQLTMNPTKQLDDVEYCSLFLSLADYGKGQDRRPPSVVRADFQITICNADGQPGFRTASSTGAFEYLGILCGWRKLVKCSFLSNPDHRLVVNDTLKIHCKVAVLGVKQKMSKIGMTHGTPSAKQRNASFKNHFARDFGKMFRESVATDVIILTGNSTFQAHTFILKARSSVFAAMFNTNMIENETKTLTISDFDDVVVKGMLEYLYTGATDCMAERAPELLQIAEKYDLDELKEDCEYAMAESLSRENAAMFWLLADAHNAPYLKQCCQNFIYTNKVDLMQPTVFDATVIKMKVKVHSASDELADLFLAQLFIEAGHVINNVL